MLARVELACVIVDNDWARGALGSAALLGSMNSKRRPLLRTILAVAALLALVAAFGILACSGALTTTRDAQFGGPGHRSPQDATTPGGGGPDGGVRTDFDGADVTSADQGGSDDAQRADGGSVAACPSFASPTVSGTVTATTIDEASGLVASRANTGVLWVHNDSGDKARLFALSKRGQLLGTYALDGASKGDFEDLAAGPGPVADQQYLYVGDIGDNHARRASVVVYRGIEPSLSADQAPPLEASIKVVPLLLRYPDGAHNAETLLVDPRQGDLYIVTKSLLADAGVYRAAAPHQAGSTRTLDKVGTLRLPGVLVRALTAGDISPDGQQVLLRTYSNALLWRRLPGTSVMEALSTDPCPVPLAIEPQGESIGFDPQSGGYLTHSESTNQPLYFFAHR